MSARIEAELKLLRHHYERVEHVHQNALHWFRVEPLITPDKWVPDRIPVVFSVTEGHPGASPYGFYVPATLAFNGAPPADASTPNQPPFPGGWRFLSWQAEGWNPAADVTTGSNLWAWVRSFTHRLREGK